MTAITSDIKWHKYSLVVFFGERMADCLDIQVKRIHCAGKWAEVFKVKSGGPYNKNCVLRKGYARVASSPFESRIVHLGLYPH
jgi:hypothetical protein